MFAEALGSLGAGEGIGGGTAALLGGQTGLQMGLGIYNAYLQKKNMEWMRDAQKKTWQREDNAIQRRVRDLEAAGLSPVLAAGQGAGAGQVVSTTAPQIDDDLPQKFMNLIKMQNDIAMTSPQRDLIIAQKDAAKAQANAANSAADKSKADAELTNWDRAKYEELGIPSTMSANAKDASVVIDIYKKLKGKAKGMTDEELEMYNVDGSLKPKYRGKNYRPGSRAGSW